jgi:hypothetical protein
MNARPSGRFFKKLEPVPMCDCKLMKLIFTILLLVAGLLVAKNIPELRRYLRIASM